VRGERPLHVVNWEGHRISAGTERKKGGSRGLVDALRELQIAAERVRHPHLLRRPALRLEQTWVA
jgi:hypothetical protein